MKAIDGVNIISLKKVVNGRGHLVEVQREDDVHYPGFGQAYVTCTPPGLVKAWYRHQKQFDQLAIIHGEIVTALYDSRESSATLGCLIEIVVSEDHPLLVQIPPGIWHGFKTLGSKAAYLLHLNTAAYNFEQTDEDRLPSDTPSIPYQW